MRIKLITIAALLSSLAAYMCLDPSSPWDPTFRRDPKPGATPERRQSMWVEYEYMLADPWSGMTDDATRDGVKMRMDKMVAEWPEEFPPR